MTDKTLYLIQSQFANNEHCIQQVQKTLDSNDALVLMGDAVLGLFTSSLLTIQNKVYVLDRDAELLPSHLLNGDYFQIEVIDYTTFADIILGFTRCISLK